MQLRKNKHNLRRYLTFLLGISLSAFAFNLFYAPNNIVTGSSTGVGLIIRHLLSIDPSITVFIISLNTLTISYFLLDKEFTKNSLIGTIIYPILLNLTAYPARGIDLSNVSVFLLMLYGGILTGIGNGLMLKTGFSNGGFMIFYQLIHKYFKISQGVANLIINSIIVIVGSLIFGLPNLFYAIITLVVSSYFTDKLILGISDSKAFYIITSKCDEVKSFIINNLHHSVTLIDSEGGFTKNKQKIIMCVIPTKEYYLVKEVVTELDPSSFFLITDAYEVSGGI